MTMPLAQVVGTQYYDTGWVMIFFVLIISSFILFNIFRSKARAKDMYIRRIAGLNAIDEAIGRATEMGKPVLMVPGLGTLNAISVQALNIFAYVTKTAARFANPIRLCCGDAAVYTVAQEIIRDVYQSEGVPDRYDPDSVRFLSDRQFAFAASVSGIILREQTSACFFMGEFFAESLIFAETANSIGAIQVASSTQITQTPFFIAACDYVLIGEEFYAASAYLTREPVLVGSLAGQDWAKVAMIVLVLFGALSNSLDRSKMTSYMRDGNGFWVAVDPNQAENVKINGNWEPIQNRYGTLSYDDIHAPGGVTAEDGSVTFTYSPAKALTSDGEQVLVNTLSVPKSAASVEANQPMPRILLGKFTKIDGKWQQVEIKSKEDFGEDTAKPVMIYSLAYDGKEIPVEEAQRHMKAGESLMGQIGSPGEPPAIDYPREKEPDATKEAK